MTTSRPTVRALAAAGLVLACSTSPRDTGPVPAAEPLSFAERPTAMTARFIGSVGSAWMDVDGDGRTDVALANRDSATTQVYRQTAEGFVRVPLPLEREANSVAWGDTDGDGVPDLMTGGTLLEHFRSDTAGGTLRLVPITAAAEFADTVNFLSWDAVAFGDADLDGDLDLLAARYSRRHTPALFTNDGRGRFTADTVLAVGASGYLGGAHVTDLGGGARLLLTGSPLRDSTIGSFILRPGSTPRRLDPMAGGLGSSLADIDGDLDLDLFIGGWREADTSRLYLNDGGTFRRTEAPALGLPKVLGSAFGDLDNDGDLDLVLSTGYTEPGRLHVFLADSGRFRSVEVPGLSEVRGPLAGLVLIDLDRDGRLDLFVTSPLTPNRLLMSHASGDAGWLQVELSGPGTWGARVILETTDGRRQLRSVHQQSGYGGHTEPVAHFGLGTARPRRVTVEWPTGAATRVDVGRANERIRVSRPRG